MAKSIGPFKLVNPCERNFELWLLSCSMCGSGKKHMTFFENLNHEVVLRGCSTVLISKDKCEDTCQLL